MASKDIGTYRGGTDVNVTNTETVVVLSSTVEEDVTGWARSGNVITSVDDGAALILFGHKYKYDTVTPDPCVRLTVERKAASSTSWDVVPGGVAYTFYTNTDGVDEGTAMAFTVVDGVVGDQYRLSHRTNGVLVDAGDTADQVVGAAYIEFLCFPKQFEVAIYTKQGVSPPPATFAPPSWDDLIRKDDNYTEVGSPMKELTCAAAGRYLLVTNYCFQSVSDPAGFPNQGALMHLIIQEATTNQNFTQFRQCAPKKTEDSGSVNCCQMMIFDQAGTDVDRSVDVRFFNEGAASDDQEHLDAESVFALIKIDANPAADDGFEIRRSASSTAWHGTKTVDWNTNVRVAGGYAHSTSVDNSEVTMPTGKSLVHANLNWWRSSPADEHAGVHARFMLDTVAQVDGAGGSGINYGLSGPDPNQHQSDMHCAALVKTTSGDILEVETATIGTNADATSELAGGAAVSAAYLFGIFIDDWPADPVPAAAVASPATAGIALGHHPIRKIASFAISGQVVGNDYNVQRSVSTRGTVHCELTGVATQGQIFIVGRPQNTSQSVVLAGPIDIGTGALFYKAEDVPLLPVVTAVLQNGVSASETVSVFLAE